MWPIRLLIRNIRKLSGLFRPHVLPARDDLLQVAQTINAQREPHIVVRLADVDMLMTLTAIADEVSPATVTARTTTHHGISSYRGTAAASTSPRAANHTIAFPRICNNHQTAGYQPPDWQCTATQSVPLDGDGWPRPIRSRRRTTRATLLNSAYLVMRPW